MRHLAALLLAVNLLADPADWPRFRGPNGSGISPDAKPPVEFGPGKNLAWRTEVPPGASSPIVTANRVVLTGYESNSLITLCIDTGNGKVLWKHAVERTRKQRQSPPNDSATPTPVTDGRNVYSFFPEYGLISYTLEGRERWRLPLPPFNPPHGMATSPILTGDRLIIAADQVSDSSIAAYDTASGRQLWKTGKASLVGGYSTPVLLDGLILVSSPLALNAYSPKDGELVWSADRMGVMPISTPVIAGGLVFVNNGAVPPFEDLAISMKADKNGDGRITPDEFPDPAFKDAVLAIDRMYGNGDGAIDAKEWNGALKLMQGMNSLAAIRPGKDVAPENRVAWRLTRSLTDTPSPIVYNSLLYYVRDGGIVMVVQTETGAIVQQLRLTGAIGHYFASPVAAGGHLYFTSSDGKVAVVDSNPEHTIRAVNDLKEECYATPAICGSSLYFRTKQALYRFR